MFTSLPEDLSSNLPEYIAQLQEQNIQLHELVVQQQPRIEPLDNGITRLKKLNTSPNLKPNTKPPEDNDQGAPASGSDENDSDDKPEDRPGENDKPKVNEPDESTRRQRSQPPCPPVSEIIAPEDIPEAEDQRRHRKRSWTAMSRHLCQPEKNVSPALSFIVGLSDQQVNRHWFNFDGYYRIRFMLAAMWSMQELLSSYPCVQVYRAERCYEQPEIRNRYFC